MVRGKTNGRTTAQPRGQDWPATRPELWSLAQIQPYANNPRTHPPEEIAALAADMLADGVTMPILVDEVGVIIAGHGRLQAAQQNNFERYPVVVARGWSEEQKRSARIRDNQRTLMGQWSPELLKLEISELKLAGYDVPLLGFSDMQLASFLNTDVAPPSAPIPPVPKNPVTKTGDIWQLGKHRIFCGDCRDQNTVAKLMSGRKINLGFTSPPYAEQRDYDESSGFRPVPPDEYVDWFAAVAQNVAAHLADDGSWFVNIKPNADGLDTNLYVFDIMLIRF